jgi:hypothetical protein
MDVDAKQLGDLLEDRGVLNLGTLSYLSLDAFALMLDQYVAVHPGKVKAVVLLLHPESLRRQDSEDYFMKLLDSIYEDASPAAAGVSHMLGIAAFRDRILSRLLPRPLPGGYGRRYGFTHDLWRYMDEHEGSAVAPGQFVTGPGQGNAEYRIAPEFEALSEGFKTGLPWDVKLIIAITPAPASFVLPDYGSKHNEMLETWARWISADAALDDLPGTMADSLFASTTHLNERGVIVYTKMLADALQAQGL